MFTFLPSRNFTVPSIIELISTMFDDAVCSWSPSNVVAILLIHKKYRLSRLFGSVILDFTLDDVNDSKCVEFLNVSLRVILTERAQFQVNSSEYQHCLVALVGWGKFHLLDYIVTSFLWASTFKIFSRESLLIRFNDTASSSKMSRHKVRKTFSFLHLHCIILMKHSWINIFLFLFFSQIFHKIIFSQKIPFALKGKQKTFPSEFHFYFLVWG